MAARICGACGAVVPAGSSFCGRCGVRLGARPTPDLRADERRQLTVMFCDLVGSTEITELLDVEETRAFVQRYQACCVEIIERWGGFVARYVGDGLLVYFGYPHAHGDDGARAVRAGLELVEAVAALGEIAPGLAEPSARIGIDTGEVVIGDMGAGQHRQAMDIVGSAPNVASRLLALAEPGSVVLSDATRRLVEGYVDLEPLGEANVRGISRQMLVYRAVRPTGAEGRFDVVTRRGLLPLVDRTDELAVLTSNWRRTRDGDGAAVLVVGEAGIGKSRLLHELVAAHVPADATVIELRCSPDHTTTPLHPVARHFTRLIAGPTPLAALEKALSGVGVLEVDAVPLIAELLGVEGAPAPTALPIRKLDRTLTMLHAWVTAQGRTRPTVLLAEDVHWVDPSTGELIARLVEGSVPAGVLVVLSARPEFVAPWGAMASVVSVPLGRLGAADASVMVRAAAGERGLHADLADQVAERADGVPLFIEELTAAAVESGAGRPPGVPATLQDSLMARLDRIGPARDVAGVASVIGREFTPTLLARVLAMDEITLDVRLADLVSAGLLQRAHGAGGTVYRFKHALVRDAAYNSLLVSERRRLHATIATELDAMDTREAPEVIARHYTIAGDPANAIRHWRRASRAAQLHGAVSEAIDALDEGLRTVQAIPESEERDRHELRLLLPLGPLLSMQTGGADVRMGEVCNRSRHLATSVGSLQHRLQILAMTRGYHQMRGEHHETLAVARELAELAEIVAEPTWQIIACDCVGSALVELGRLSEARPVLERALAMYEPDMHSIYSMTHGWDPGVIVRSEWARILWHRGEPDAALRVFDGVYDDVALLHPFTRGFIAIHHAMLHFLRREPARAAAWAQETYALAAEHGHAHLLAQAELMLGWTAAMADPTDDAVDQIRHAIDRQDELGVKNTRDRGLLMLADALVMLGRDEDALAIVRDAQGCVARSSGMREAPDLWRLEGEVHMRLGDTAAAETALRSAVTIARQTESLMYELRALTALAHACPDDVDVRTDLAAVFAAHRDGHDLADLRGAAAVLES